MSAGVQFPEAKVGIVFSGMKPGESLVFPNRQGRPLVLLLGDRPETSAFVAECMTGFSIVTEKDGTSGLQKFADKQPELIVVDTGLVGVAADEVIRDIRSRREFDGVPVLVLSAEDDYVQRAKVLQQGVQDYVLKPFTKDELLFRVHNLIAMRRVQVSSRLRDEFIATLSHELRTPLTAVHGWLQVLQTSRADEAMRERALDSIRRNTVMQISLIDDLLDVSRVITGKLQLDRQQVDLRSIIEDLLESMCLAAVEKGVALSAKFEGHRTHVFGDPNRLRQIMLNLLTNAVKFTPARGRIDLSLKRLATSVEIEVADTGRGIDPEFLPHIFERFRQERRTDCRENGGLGLGLAIVKSLVELHGGAIRAESAGEGKGARFTVLLPLPHDPS